MIQDCSFQKIVIMKNGFLMIVCTSPYVVAESIGEWFYSVSGKTRSYYKNPPRTCELINLTFEDMSIGECLISFIYYPNIVIKELSILNIHKPTKNDPNDYVIRFFKDSRKYFSHSPSSSLFMIKELLTIIDVEFFYYSYFEKITISEVNVKNSDILDFSAIYAQNAESNFTINGFSFKSTQINSSAGVALHCLMVKSLISTGIKIEKVINGYFGFIGIEKTENVSMTDLKGVRVLGC